MRYQRYTVSPACYPRYNNAITKTSKLFEKYKHIREQNRLKVNTKDICQIKEIDIYLGRGEDGNQTSLGIKDIILKQEDLKEHGTVDCITYENTSLKGHIQITVIDSMMKEEIKTLFGFIKQLVVITKDDAEIERMKTEMQFEDSTTSLLTTKERAARDICNWLERIALKPMKEMCEYLDQVLKDRRLENSNENQFSSSNLKCQEKCFNQENVTLKTDANTIDPITTENIAECDDSGIYGMDASPDTKYDSIGNESPQEACASSETYSQDLDEETGVNLLKEMLAVYGMSNVPQCERPDISEIEEIHDSVKKQIFTASDAIIGIGYRVDKLHVFVQDREDKSENEKCTSQVREVLSQLGIHHFNIVPVNFKELMHVGAKIHPIPTYGTLGCYAKMSDGHRCILLAKHVAMLGTDIYSLDHNKKIATVIGKTTAKCCKLDIAAALVDGDATKCCTKFRNSSGKKLEGKLYEYGHNSDSFVVMEGQAVHIWGATSDPGKGVISMSKYQDGMDSPLILIRDEESSFTKDGNSGTSLKFAKPGDSGAIVCIDHPDDEFVYAVGMLTGLAELRMDPKQEHYTALPLSEGMAQLQESTGKTFELI
ncbi:uncharacterized protein LOC128554440 [Mercenaria mercenaria]|uniref:uncharacterized protein LOC128554440 n=1 Tax=Mercenaria mercenaria TaxID=6596 RepID=UPI00234F86B1|nr:uncharacterized protein LOC128554440 [Mercenaria mercenaria]